MPRGCLALAPEFIVPQDGQEKQDCERAAAKRWLASHHDNYDPLSSQKVEAIVSVGRTRWKVENETINVLKHHGYHLERNFGHGEQHFATVIFALNLLAFLIHTTQHLLNPAYRLLHETLVVRRTFFNDLKALTRYLVFDSWEALFAFMLEGLELGIPPT